MSTPVSWDPTLGYSDWPSIPTKILKSPGNKPAKARNNTEWQINIRERENCSKLTRFFRAEGWERLYWRKRLEVPPWELNGWLQYVDGKFMYFQTGGCWPLLGVSGTLVTTRDIWWWHRVWVATDGRGGGREEIIYPRFIVKLLTALERLEPQPPGQTQPGSNATFKRECFSSFEMRLQSRSHVPRVLRTIVCCVSHEDTGHKNSKWREREQVPGDRDAFQTSSIETWEGVHCSTGHNLNSNLAMKGLNWSM